MPSLPKDDQPVSRSRKRQRLNINGISTDPNAPEDGLEYGVVLETSKERFLVVRHGKIAQSTSANGMNEIASNKPTFTISLVQGEVEMTRIDPTPLTKPEELEPAPVEEAPKSPVPVPDQPTKEPSPVEPLPPVSTPQESKLVVQDLERERSTSVVDMELDTPASVTPTATVGPDITSVEKNLPNGSVPETSQDAVLQNSKPRVDVDQPQPEGIVSQEDVSAESVLDKVEAAPPKSPSPTLATATETARPLIPPLTSVPALQPQTRGLPQVKLKLQILQRNVREEDLVFGDDGLGVLSADVDPLDNTKKGWLIEAPRWRTYNCSISDSVVVD